MGLHASLSRDYYAAQMRKFCYDNEQFRKDFKEGAEGVAQRLTSVAFGEKEKKE